MQCRIGCHWVSAGHVSWQSREGEGHHKSIQMLRGTKDMIELLIPDLSDATHKA